MKYFLDFGTHCFEGLEEFISKINLDSTFNVLCYEPNLDIFNKSKQKTELINKYISTFISFEHNNLAIMDYTGEISFNSHKGAWTNNNKNEYIQNYTTGSNCLDINPSFDAGNGVVFDIITTKCKCIDIDEIITKIVNNDNDAIIYIKCDIEGSEFIVLPKLLKSNHLKHIDSIYIEWHERFWQGTNEYNSKVEQKRLIINSFNNNNVKTFIHT